MDYSYLIIPIIAVITSQAIKLLTDGIRGNFDLKNMLMTYGGMPSSHTAFAVSISTLVGLRLGFDSAVFAVALIFTLIVVRDAVTFRRILGEQRGQKLGHSLPEVLAGAVWGIALTYFLNLI